MSEPASHESLTAALVEVQAHLPVIAKDRTAKVKTKTGGDYSYSYVDLATISAAVLPLLAAAGLAWTTLPTLDDAGRFVLRYALRHVSGELLEGIYPLPTGGSAQELGSAITYGRRYTLCSVVGVAPDEDDDGAAAVKTHARPPKQEPAQPTGPPLASAGQLKELGIAFNDYGLTDRESRLTFVSGVIGRELASSKELTVVEAKRVLEVIRADTDPPAAAVEDSQEVPE